jgi:mRNA interferase RelE/StbE
LAYKLGYKKSVIRDLKTLSKADATRVLDLIEDDILPNPEANPVLKGKFAGLRKYRTGHFRVISSIIGTDVRILRIAHREVLYRREI